MRPICRSRLLRPVAAAALCVSAPALAQWSTDPGSPLVVGPAAGLFAPRQSMVTTDDGAVWVAWQNSFCVGDVRLQRIAPDASLLAPGGIATHADETCGLVLPPLLLPSGNSVLVDRAYAGLHEEPVRAFDESGVSAWPADFSIADPSRLELAAALAGGDVLVVSHLGTTIRADRLDASGVPVWAKPSTFGSETGSSLRVFGVAPDSSGGAYVVWDSSSFAYTRLIRMQRLDAQGKPAWPVSVRLMTFPPDVTSSRHTDPVAVADDQGGAIVFFAQGFETAFGPAALLMQRVGPDGDLAFSLDGHRVSLSPQRQFDPIVHKDAVTGEFLLVWREGLLDDQWIIAQRVNLAGDRLWGDQGVPIAPITQSDAFDAAWAGGTLSIAIASAEGVTLHSLDADGSADPSPVVVGTGAAPISVRLSPSGDGLVVSWQADLEGLDDAIVAQRVNPGGRLGDPACNAGDLAAPFGALDFSDAVAFLSAFGTMDLVADLATPFGSLDFSDVTAFLVSFAAGCP